MARKTKGQTLIETLAAIFILTMGVTAGVGLANYALGSSTSITKDVIATGLAREGVEALKNMRDTNWLQAGTISSNCYDYSQPSANDGSCYKNWLTLYNYGAMIFLPNPFTGQNIAATLNPPANPTPYILAFFGSDLVSPSQAPSGWQAPYADWGLYQANSPSVAAGICGGGTSLSYALNSNNKTPAITALASYGAGYYVPNCNINAKAGTSGFYRKITLQVITTAPFNQSDSNNDLAELYVKSQVWWVDNKRCAPSADWPGAGKCSVEIDTYLTNWKTY